MSNQKFQKISCLISEKIILINQLYFPGNTPLYADIDPNLGKLSDKQINLITLINKNWSKLLLSGEIYLKKDVSKSIAEVNEKSPKYIKDQLDIWIDWVENWADNFMGINFVEIDRNGNNFKLEFRISAGYWTPVLKYNKTGKIIGGKL
jgi:hypothetical protein